MDLNSNYQIMSFSTGDTKAGTKMGKMQLKNLSDDTSLNCILWEEALGRIDEKTFRTGNIVKLKTATYNEKFNNCNVTSIELIEQAKLGLEETQREEFYKKLMAYVDGFSDVKLLNFVKKTLEENKELFKTIPAAKAMHHNFVGGLLVHTLECVEFAELIMPRLENKISKDDVYAACILHDIGKIYEYKVNLETGLIEYSEEFKKDWLTHSQYGFSLCMNAGFPKIAKMIAAHHGRADWGAMIDLDQRDLEPFYYLVHHIDDLSAKFGKITVRDI